MMGIVERLGPLERSKRSHASADDEEMMMMMMMMMMMKRKKDEVKMKLALGCCCIEDDFLYCAEKPLRRDNHQDMAFPLRFKIIKRHQEEGCK
ncbi:hypothetical protein KQX54_015493 [Cotesia glomerata]|uniref:Uncharacterized protein n=1 Tax=Cotesia glomerata TaxID=32391 RepID=A0AAV7IVB3_COTGL|nr:hypothetical protein KQX54_015493 [Cotesia glomerata]